jgi:3-isopropylmalate dehydratase small subunit
MRRQMERELDRLEVDLREGRITQSEYNQEVREIERAYQHAAEESARDAYDRELGRW